MKFTLIFFIQADVILKINGKVLSLNWFLVFDFLGSIA